MTDDEIETELSQLSDHELIRMVEEVYDHHTMTRREELAVSEAGWRELEF